MNLLSKTARPLLFTVLLFSFATSAWAEVTLEGRVTSAESGDALRLANIGTRNALETAVTDDGGNFSLSVESLPVTLVVRHLGYQVYVMEISSDAFLDIALVDSKLQAEEMVVIGSRFAPRTVMTSPVPIDNVKADQLYATGHLTIDKMLNYSVPSFNSSQQTISDATAHFDPADLRGLGPSRTLVLINGKRKNPSALVYINDTPGKGEVGVDMKSIPAAAIERIEVLRDGASAQYGSDAIAGVINIILKEDYDQTIIRSFGGATTEGDGENYGYSVNTGFPLGKNGSVNVTHSYSDFSETNRAPTPGTDALFGVTPETDVNGDGIPGDFADFFAAHPDLGMIVGQPNITSSDVFFNARLPLENNSELYAFGGLQNRKGLSYALYRAPYWITEDPDIPGEASEVYLDSDGNYEGFHPTFETDIFDNQLSVGVRGQSRGWDYDVSHTYGSNTVDYSVNNSLNVDLGIQTPTSFRAGGYEFRNHITNADVARQVMNATVSVGTEFRTENFVANAGEPDSYFGSGTQSFPGLQPQNEADAFRNNIGVYGDVAVNVTEDLLVGGAARVENYSDFGDAFTWKVNGRHLLMDGRATVRASASTGFRAPSLHQIHLSIIQTLVSGGSVSNQGTIDNNSPVLRALEVDQLKEEEATNFTVGVAIQPVEGATFSADFYRVEVDDRVVYSSSIASDDPTDAVGEILVANDITSLKFFTNAIDTRTQGVDLVGTYSMAAGEGTANVTVSATFTDTEIEGLISTPKPIKDAGIDIFDRKEQSRILSARPEDKILVGLGYSKGRVNATLNNTRFGEVTWQHASDPAKDQTFAAKVITDLYVTVQATGALSLGIAVNNLFDVFPDKIDTKGDVLTDLGGRFQYPWEVNQFGFAGTTVVGSGTLTF